MSGNRSRRVLIFLLGVGIGVQLVFVIRMYLGPMLSRYGFDRELISHWAIQEIQKTMLEEGLAVRADNQHLVKLTISTKSAGNEIISAEVIDEKTGEIMIWEMTPSEIQFYLKSVTHVSTE